MGGITVGTKAGSLAKSVNNCRSSIRTQREDRRPVADRLD